MKKKSTPAKIVIKRLGRKSGNISAAKLMRQDRRGKQHVFHAVANLGDKLK